jgi:hypothetical protein
VAVTMLALLGLGASAAASGATGSAKARHAVVTPCDVLAARIAGWQALREGVASAVATLQQQVASGGLRPRQLALVQRLLARLEDQLVRLDDRIAGLQERYAARCGGSTGGGDGGGGDGGF